MQELEERRPCKRQRIDTSVLFLLQGKSLLLNYLGLFDRIVHRRRRALDELLPDARAVAALGVQGRRCLPISQLKPTN